MRKAKRGGSDFTRSFRKNRRACKNDWVRRACKTDWVSGCLCDEDSNQDVCTKLSDLSKSDFCKSVASITLCNGDVALFSCSGIAISRQGHHLTKFLTTASLVRAFDGKTSKHFFDLKIEVRHKGKEAYRGFMAEYDLDRNFAIVDVHTFLDVDVEIFHRALESVPCGEACVVWRDVCGDLMSKSVELGGDLRISDDKDLDCETLEACEGGSVFSFDGEFVGMNLLLVTGRAIFLPWSALFKHLECYWTSWQRETGLAMPENLKFYWFGALVGCKSNSCPEAHTDLLNQEQLDLDSMGYPKLPSTMIGADMTLVNTFEETFGDMCGEGVWTKLTGNATSSIGRNVVALASFNGETRFFACTGFFIEWNDGSTVILTSASLIRNGDRIVENLRIKVCLRENEYKEGKLEHYDLHYNVALVSVKNRRDLRPANTLLSWVNCVEVAAVGRCFKSGKLMAKSGRLVSWTGTLDCDFLSRSTCKITKAGIGGPLVTLAGDVLGMNFYDSRIGTPFLFWQNIHMILESFKLKSKAGEIRTDNNPSGAPLWKMDGDDTTRLNRWPVPMPCWRHRVAALKDKAAAAAAAEEELKHDYERGEIIVLL
ncbi:unnamed protein product [Urochloa humidicola]